MKSMTHWWAINLIILWLCTVSLLTCSNTSRAQPLYHPEQFETSPSTMIAEPLTPDHVLVPQTEINKIIEVLDHCADFSTVCQRRVGLLEAYKEQADAIITSQENNNTNYREEIKRNENGKKYLYSGVALLLGIVTGKYIFN